MDGQIARRALVCYLTNLRMRNYPDLEHCEENNDYRDLITAQKVLLTRDRRPA